MGTRKVDLKEAAAELGITSEAVRRRAKRGTLPSENGEDGRLYVWLPDVSDNGPRTGPHAGYDAGVHAGESSNRLLHEALLERVEDENDFLRRELERLHEELESRREELRRKDHLLAAAIERLSPALEEASSEQRESPVESSENGDKDEAPPDKEQRSWWHRLFGTPPSRT